MTSEAPNLVAAGIAVIGVWIAADAAAQLLTFETNHWLILHRLVQAPFHLFSESATPEEARVRAGAVFSVGSIVFFGSEGLARLWDRVRTAGHEKS